MVENFFPLLFGKKMCDVTDFLFLFLKKNCFDVNGHFTRPSTKKRLRHFFFSFNMLLFFSFLIFGKNIEKCRKKSISTFPFRQHQKFLFYFIL